ncbi:MAG TPA: TlpA disulfide reductase family protein [Vicinamibacterales bacterium]|nr:TlpA disulfide reductase family protein [Vicinamibacterales bacterium]
MTSRRALVLVLAILAFVVAWAASRYALQVGGARGDAQAAAVAPPADEAVSGEKVTLRFFRNPAVAPAFEARDLDGRPVSTASLRGKVVLLNFWATWCPPCRAEIPDLIALQDKYRDQLQIIGISEDEGGAELVKRFVDAHHMNYPVVMASPDLEKKYPGIGALPTSFVIDRQSRLVQKHVGMLTARTTEYETRHLAGLPVNVAIEEVDQTQGLKLENGAQLLTIPGVDLAKLPPAKRAEALEKLNSQPCTCGCDLTVAKCRVDDPSCGVSLPLARQIVAQIAAADRR